ncbi:hypothetical protein PILCRDRAFT_146374 [Piloderma croceum F 1598]|uniref:Uncharacterized protein n=1 Tax=Piloderma croceum (strain F 1598) TaxID=765440 RepID=A0A0C3GJE2_PILCF|nr:hypothetical protein PILCRDRAFT_146374 [Piloderma croceum F 1598]
MKNAPVRYSYSQQARAETTVHAQYTFSSYDVHYGFAYRLYKLIVCTERLYRTIVTLGSFFVSTAARVDRKINGLQKFEFRCEPSQLEDDNLLGRPHCYDAACRTSHRMDERVACHCSSRYQWPIEDHAR